MTACQQTLLAAGRGNPTIYLSNRTITATKPHLTAAPVQSRVDIQGDGQWATIRNGVVTPEGPWLSAVSDITRYNLHAYAQIVAGVNTFYVVGPLNTWVSLTAVQTIWTNELPFSEGAYNGSATIRVTIADGTVGTQFMNVEFVLDARWT